MRFNQNIYITEKILDTIFWVNTLLRGKVTFCGSVGLVLNDVLHRPIHDIDCITDENLYGAFFEQIGQYGLSTSNSEKFQVDGVWVLCFKLTAPNGMNVDVMYREDGTKSKKVYLNGKKESGEIKLELPECAIEVKRNYLKRMAKLPSGDYLSLASKQSIDKHKADLEYIDALLESRRKRSTVKAIRDIEESFDDDINFFDDDINF